MVTTASITARRGMARREGMWIGPPVDLTQLPLRPFAAHGELDRKYRQGGDRNSNCQRQRPRFPVVSPYEIY